VGQEEGINERMTFMWNEVENRDDFILNGRNRKIMFGKGGYMGYGADGAIILGQVIPVVVMVRDCCVCDNKQQ
jgi:hypothetical protein